LELAARKPRRWLEQRRLGDGQPRARAWVQGAITNLQSDAKTPGGVPSQTAMSWRFDHQVEYYQKNLKDLKDHSSLPIACDERRGSVRKASLVARWHAARPLVARVYGLGFRVWGYG